MNLISSSFSLSMRFPPPQLRPAGLRVLRSFRIHFLSVPPVLPLRTKLSLRFESLSLKYLWIILPGEKYNRRRQVWKKQ